MFFAKKHLQITEGKILPNTIRYTIPIIFTNLLQVFYVSAGMFVLGNFSGNENALGSVGNANTIVNLILSIFIGFGAAVNIVVSEAIGAGDKARAKRAVHTSVLLALILGAVVGVVGYIFAPTFLTWMGTDVAFFEGSVQYMQIYFAGTIANLLYFFCAGILRAKGDAVHPLVFSTIGGLCNVLLNLLFVIVFGMDVDGVAYATVAAQVIQAVLIVVYMFGRDTDDPCGLNMKEFGFDLRVFKDLFFIGMPLVIRSAAFGFSNIIIQVGINSLLPIYVTANTAAYNIESYIYNVLNAFHHTALTFTAQNYGARKLPRMKKTMYTLMATVTVIGLILGGLAVIFAEPLVAIFTKVPEAVPLGRIKLLYVAIPYLVCGITEVLTAMLASLGYSGLSTIICLAGVCGIRIAWVYTVFQKFHTFEMLFFSYPLSWSVTAIVLYIATLVGYKKKAAILSEKGLLDPT